MRKYDAIIIGGGHNGLVAASYLAKKYKSILLLESRHIVGGAAQTEELHPGFKFSRFSYLLSLMRPVVMQELQLVEQGLKLFRRPISSITVTKNPGEYLLMNSDMKFTKSEIAKFSVKDSEAFEEYNRFLTGIINSWSPYQDTYPVDPKAEGNANKGLHDFKQYINIARHVLIHRKQLTDYIAFATSSSSQFLNKWFESDILKSTLVTDGIIGEMVGIDTPAMAYVLLHHVMGEVIPECQGEWAFVEGGMGSISRILEKIARQRGVSIEVGASVSKILTESGSAKGVELMDGRQFHSDLILSNCSPRVTFEKMLDKDAIKDSSFNSNIKHLEYNGACTKFNFALSELPQFTCFNGTQYQDPNSVLYGTIHMGCESFDQLRQGYLEVLNGQPFSKNLFIDMVIPSVHDKTISPDGQHVAHCLVQYTPYKQKNGWTPQMKSELSQHVIDYITSYAPNFKKSVLFADVLTPFDIEKVLNMSEGNIFHGALTLDNLYSNRPSSGYNSYSSPVKGLYLCGSGAHPGGGVMGAPGRNCANYILQFHK